MLTQMWWWVRAWRSPSRSQKHWSRAHWLGTCQKRFFRSKDRLLEHHRTNICSSLSYLFAKSYIAKSSEIVRPVNKKWMFFSPSMTYSRGLPLPATSPIVGNVLLKVKNITRATNTGCLFLPNTSQNTPNEESHDYS